MKDPHRPFTKEELDALRNQPESQAELFSEAPGSMTVGEFRAMIRAKYLAPPSLGAQLRAIQAMFEGAEMGMVQIGPAARATLIEAAAYCDNAEKWTQRRPIAELRQEPWSISRNGRPGSPDRWIILWAPSGYKNVPWRCAVGRMAAATEHVDRRFITHSGDAFTDGGEDATHFSELPIDG